VDMADPRAVEAVLSIMSRPWVAPTRHFGSICIEHPTPLSRQVARLVEQNAQSVRKERGGVTGASL